MQFIHQHLYGVLMVFLITNFVLIFSKGIHYIFTKQHLIEMMIFIPASFLTLYLVNLAPPL